MTTTPNQPDKHLFNEYGVMPHGSANRALRDQFNDMAADKLRQLLEDGYPVAEVRAYAADLAASVDVAWCEEVLRWQIAKRRAEAAAKKNKAETK